MRRAVERDQVVEHTYEARPWNRGADLDREAFVIAFVENRQAAKPLTAIERVGHVIDGPRAIERRRRDQWLTYSRGQASLRAPWQIQAQRAVHAMHVFVIPSISLTAQAIEALPESQRPWTATSAVSAAITAASVRVRGSGGR